MTATQPDHGKLIGMSLMAGRDDIEVAAATVRELGFEGMEVHASQIGPGLPGVPVFEAHAAAVGDVIRRAGLIVSTLNVVGDATFDPFGGPDALTTTIEGLASAHALGGRDGRAAHPDLGGPGREARRRQFRMRHAGTGRSRRPGTGADLPTRRPFRASCIPSPSR